MRNTEVQFNYKFGGKNSEAIVKEYYQQKKARDEARINGFERKSHSVNIKPVTSLINISKYTNNLIDPKLEINDGDTSVKYYAL